MFLYQVIDFLAIAGGDSASFIFDCSEPVTSHQSPVTSQSNTAPSTLMVFLISHWTTKPHNFFHITTKQKQIAAANHILILIVMHPYKKQKWIMAIKMQFQCSTFVLPGESDPARTYHFIFQFKDFRMDFGCLYHEGQF